MNADDRYPAHVWEPPVYPSVAPDGEFGAPVADDTAPLPPPSQRTLSELPPPSAGFAPTLTAPRRPGRERTGLRAAVIGGVVGAIVAGLVSLGVVKATDHDTSSRAVASSELAKPEATAPGLDVRALLAKVGPSVVKIEVTTDTGKQAGSGVIISADGLVLTNAHVIAGGNAIQVTLSDGKQIAADVVGSSPSNDVAVIRLQGKPTVTAAVLGDSSKLQVGDTVIAIGNALNLGDAPTVTQGIVSAKGRSLDTGTVKYTNLIQTDAAINHGNSGGPLVNTAGEVIGINTAGIPDAQNIGFAIDIDAVKPIIADLEQGKGSDATVPPNTNAAFLGVSTVSIGDVSASDRQAAGIAATSGAIVVQVDASSGAADAGIYVGDAIQGVDGTKVTSPDDLRKALSPNKPGDSVTVAIQRGDQHLTVNATLTARPTGS
jgi:putative serine protease PepD